MADLTVMADLTRYSIRGGIDDPGSARKKQAAAES
jgi:hypothetical protein